MNSYLTSFQIAYANQVLQKFQSHESAWLAVDKILIQSQALMSKFLAL